MIPKKPKHIPKFDDLTGESPKMEIVFQRIREAASSDVTVLVLGESGTGKELVAESIHRHSARKNGPFIPVNTGAISRDLVANELFGHQKGSFTGALEMKTGKFEQANGGTIFLDEISSMDETTQISLLRVIETKMIQRIGGKQFLNADVRIIGASNVDLFSLNKQKEPVIREDLFHRLSVFTITLPPLREREGDIIILAYELLMQANQEFEKQVRGFHKSTLDTILEYAWPGNIREMKNVIQRAVLISKGKTILREDLPERVRNSKKGFEDIVFPVGIRLKDAEKFIIQKTLVFTKGNRKRTAEILGISRSALYNKLEQYKIN